MCSSGVVKQNKLYVSVAMIQITRYAISAGNALSRLIDLGSSVIGKKKKKEMFYLTTHSTHFIYGYMASDIW